MKFFIPAFVTVLVGCQTVTVPPAQLNIPVSETLEHVLKDNDHDQDKKITVHDGKDIAITFSDQKSGKPITLRGAYPVSVLLQELTIAKEHNQDYLEINWQTLNGDPAERTSEMIRN